MSEFSPSDDLVERLACFLGYFARSRTSDRYNDHRLGIVWQFETTAQDIGVKVADPAGGESESRRCQTDVLGGYGHVNVGMIFAIGAPVPRLVMKSDGHNDGRSMLHKRTVGVSVYGALTLFGRAQDDESPGLTVDGAGSQTRRLYNGTNLAVGLRGRLIFTA